MIGRLGGTGREGELRRVGLRKLRKTREENKYAEYHGE